MTRNGQRTAQTTTSRLEVRWSRCAWKPRIALEAISRERPVSDGNTGGMTLYRRSGGRVSARAADPLNSMPVVDWVAVRYENLPPRITF